MRILEDLFAFIVANLPEPNSPWTPTEPESEDSLILKRWFNEQRTDIAASETWWESGGGIEWAERFLEFSQSPQFDAFLEEMEDSPAVGLTGHTLAKTSKVIGAFLQGATSSDERRERLVRLRQLQPGLVEVWQVWLTRGHLVGGLFWDDQAADSGTASPASATDPADVVDASPATTDFDFPMSVGDRITVWFRRFWVPVAIGGLAIGLVAIGGAVFLGGDDDGGETGLAVAPGDEVDIVGSPDEPVDEPLDDVTDEPDDALAAADDAADESAASCDGGIAECDESAGSIDDCIGTGCAEGDQSSDPTECNVSVEGECLAPPLSAATGYQFTVMTDGACGWPNDLQTEQLYVWPHFMRAGDEAYRREPGYSLLGLPNSMYIQFRGDDWVGGNEPRGSGDVPTMENTRVGVDLNNRGFTFQTDETRFDDGVPCTEQRTYGFELEDVTILEYMTLVPTNQPSDDIEIDGNANYDGTTFRVEGTITGTDQNQVDLHLECSGLDLVYQFLPVPSGSFAIEHQIADCVVVNFTFVVNGNRVGAGSVSAPADQ